MATPTVSSNPVVQRHYAVQLGISKSLGEALARIGVSPSSPDYLRIVSALVAQYQGGAISLARDYYGDMRDQAAVRSAFRVPTISPAPEGAIRAYIGTATEELDILSVDYERQVAEFAKNLAISAGTDELFAAKDADPERVRWARVTRPQACSFCLMLASRGAVYRTEDTATFRPHKTCRCDVEMAWSTSSYEPPAHVRAAQRLWSESTADFQGEKAKQNAFRRALAAERRAA